MFSVGYELYWMVSLFLAACRFRSFSPSMLLALLQLPQDPRLALTLPDELLESEPDSHCRRRSGHLRLALPEHMPLYLGGLSGLGPILGCSGFVIRFLATLRGGSLSLSVTMLMLFSGSSGTCSAGFLRLLPVFFFPLLLLAETPSSASFSGLFF